MCQALLIYVFIAEILYIRLYNLLINSDIYTEIKDNKKLKKILENALQLVYEIV